MARNPHPSYWQTVWHEFTKKFLGIIALGVVSLFLFIAIYAPFLASSKPIAVRYNETWFFPLFRYLFYPQFYTKTIDIFFNLLIFTFPLGIAISLLCRKHPYLRRLGLFVVLSLQIIGFIYLLLFPLKDPASDPALTQRYREKIAAVIRTNEQGAPFLSLPQQPSWNDVLASMNAYARLNTVLQYQQRKAQHKRLSRILDRYAAQEKQRWIEREVRRKKVIETLPREEIRKQIETSISEEMKTEFATLPTLWERERANEEQIQQRIQQSLNRLQNEYASVVPLVQFVADLCTQDPWNFRCDFLHQLNPEPKKRLLEAVRTVRSFEQSFAEKKFLEERRTWLQIEETKITFLLMPLLSHFHWEEDAGGQESINRFVQWWELTRINGKNLMAALLFGTRISLIVGFVAVTIALLIGIPIGALAGFFGGKTDMLVYRLIEIWESMPLFFMLLLVVGIIQTKSIFLIITVIGLFSWTSYSRFIRGEFLKQRNLPYVEACLMQGLGKPYIMFSHILPNALPPVLTLLPFGVMGAITSEAGLSFLGLGEEGSCSWGVLMDEGRAAFPAESYLLWPPAIILTILLIAIALVGDAFRDALDPKMRRE